MLVVKKSTPNGKTYQERDLCVHSEAESSPKGRPLPQDPGRGLPHRCERCAAARETAPAVSRFLSSGYPRPNLGPQDESEGQVADNFKIWMERGSTDS